MHQFCALLSCSAVTTQTVRQSETSGLNTPAKLTSDASDSGETRGLPLLAAGPASGDQLFTDATLAESRCRCSPRSPLLPRPGPGPALSGCGVGGFSPLKRCTLQRYRRRSGVRLLRRSGGTQRKHRLLARKLLLKPGEGGHV